MLDHLVKFFTSLRLTVVLLALGLVLVFWGTIAQVHLGLYKAQNDFFRSFFVYWEPGGTGWKIPIFPAGYLIGGLLVINLFAAHIRYYRPGVKKLGIAAIHLGIVLLLLGQLLTDVLSRESAMHLRNGETKFYSEADRHFELAIVDTTDASKDKVMAIPQHLLAEPDPLSHAEMPFGVKVEKYFPNSSLIEKAEAGYDEVKVTAGIGAGIWWRGLPHETAMDRRDMPSALVTLTGSQGPIATYLVSAFLARPQEFAYGGRRYEISLRQERFYKPFSLSLLEFRHDKYAGTDIPKNFSSRVRLQRADNGENREVLIYMNSPLRYWGETYYQASFDPDDQGTILQVVRNPGWLTPYAGCVMVGGGMVFQFMFHLVGFITKRRTA